MIPSLLKNIIAYTTLVSLRFNSWRATSLTHILTPFNIDLVFFSHLRPSSAVTYTRSFSRPVTSLHPALFLDSLTAHKWCNFARFQENPVKCYNFSYFTSFLFLLATCYLRHIPSFPHLEFHLFPQLFPVSGN